MRKTPFYIEALEDGIVQLIQHGSNVPNVFLVCSLDNMSWSDWDYVTGTELVAG